MSKIEKFTKEYTVRSYECERNGNLRLVTLMNILQDMATSHAAAMGLGLEYCIAKGLSWVGSHYHVVLERRPKIGEKVKLTTWPAEAKKLAAIRDFQAFSEDGSNIIKATSQWVLVNFATKKPVALLDNLPQYQSIDEHILSSNFEKLPEPEHIHLETCFKIRFDDIDLNRHVNNAVYLLWASEAVPEEWCLTKEVCEIEISFKKEGLFGENVKVMTQLKHDKISLHSIQSTIDGRELARVRLHWKPL